MGNINRINYLKIKENNKVSELKINTKKLSKYELETLMYNSNENFLIIKKMFGYYLVINGITVTKEVIEPFKKEVFSILINNSSLEKENELQITYQKIRELSLKNNLSEKLDLINKKREKL